MSTLDPIRAKHAAAFRAANAKSPVVYGSVTGAGGRGCFYRLADGSTWELDRSVCAAVGYPRWQFDAEAA